MKVILSALVLSAAAFTARGDLALRGSHELKSDSGYNGLTLFLDHVKTGQTTSDDVVIGAIVDAYNKVHDNYAIKSAFKNEEIAIPDAESNGAFYDSMGRFTVGWECSSCAADDGFLPPMHVAAQASPGLHQKFVDELCQALRDSGKEAYAGITKCAVDFTYGVEQLKRMEEEAAAAAAASKGATNAALYWPWSHKSSSGPHSGIPMAAELDIHGYNPGSSQDYGEISKAFIDAYNEVHSDTPYRIENFGPDKVISVNEDGGQDTGDSSNSSGMLGRDCKTCRYVSIIGRGNWGCTLCRDDRSVLPPLQTMLVQYKESRYKVMEKLFCHYIAVRSYPSGQYVGRCKVSMVTPNEVESSLADTVSE